MEPQIVIARRIARRGLIDHFLQLVNPFYDQPAGPVPVRVPAFITGYGEFRGDPRGPVPILYSGCRFVQDVACLVHLPRQIEFLYKRVFFAILYLIPASGDPQMW